MILLFPYFLTRGGFFYDFPELAFLVIAVWMALKFNWWWMLPLVALAAWNKESFLLFVPSLYPLIRLKSSRMRALAATAALGFTVLAQGLLPASISIREQPRWSLLEWQY